MIISIKEKEKYARAKRAQRKESLLSALVAGEERVRRRNKVKRRVAVLDGRIDNGKDIAHAQTQTQTQAQPRTQTQTQARTQTQTQTQIQTQIQTKTPKETQT